MEYYPIENVSKIKSLKENLIKILRAMARSFKLECKLGKEELLSKPAEAVLQKHEKVCHEVQAKLRSYLLTR